MTRLPALLPGVAIAVTLGAVAKAANLALPLVSALLAAILIGLAVGPWVRGRPVLAPGLNWSAGTLLRAGVALLGLRLAFGELLSVGALGLAIAVAVVAVVQALAVPLGRALGVPGRMAFLLGTGSAVCGVSAIVAMAAAVGPQDQEDSAYGIGAITLLGTVALFAFPVMGSLLGLSEFQYGVWAGAALQEMAHVVAAGFAYGSDAGATATVVKLARVALLAPLVVLSMVMLRHREGAADGKRPSLLPGFVAVFLALALARSVLPIPAAALEVAFLVDELVLASAMVAVGARIDLGALARVGLRPLALGAALAVVAAALPLAIVLVAGGA